MLRVDVLLLRVDVLLLRVDVLLLRVGVLLLRVGVLLRRVGVLLRRVGVLLRRVDVLLLRVGVLLRRVGVLLLRPVLALLRLRVRALLRAPDRATRLEALSRLHPERLDGLDGLPRLRAMHQRTVEALLPLWPADAAPRQEASGVRDSLLRLCLVVQWNGFDSGLFLHQVTLI